MINKQKELEKIAEEIRVCRKCKRGKIGIAVPGEGSANAKIVFLGEAPGKEEAKSGRPFVGRSGKFLRSFIKEAGLDEKKIYITSPVKYLPKSGTPNEAEIKHGSIHLKKQLNIIKPKIVVLLGSVAYQAIFGEKVATLKLHGRIVEKEGRQYFITIHPSAAMRFTKMRNCFREDFEKLKELACG